MSRTKGAKDRQPRRCKSRLIDVEKDLIAFEKSLEEWDKLDEQIDLHDLCIKLQNALAKSYVETEQLEAKVTEQAVIIKYLEDKINGRHPV